MFIDSHCHLQHTRGLEHIQEYLLELSQSLRLCIDILITESEIRTAEKLKYPRNILRAAGIYPEFASRASAEPEFLETFETMIRNLGPDALGEVGLDWYHNHYGSRAEQEALFHRQISLALSLEIPLIVHSREAFEDTFRILSEYRFPRGLILHCFSYGPKEAEEFLSLGCRLSFAGNLTYPKAIGVQDAARIVPLDRVLFETDSPYLSPVPLRGKPNEPAHVAHTYRYFAALREIDPAVLAGMVENNFKALFPAAGIE